jgi:hypothetical protein
MISGWKLIVILVISLLLLSCDSEKEGPNADGSKLREIEQIWDTLPQYPGTVEVANSKISTGKRAHRGKSFNSAANFNDLKQFYLERLSKTGWQLVEDRRMYDWGRDLGGHFLSFTKSEYKLSIQYAGESASYGWDYVIDIYWSDL